VLFFLFLKLLRCFCLHHFVCAHEANKHSFTIIKYINPRMSIVMKFVWHRISTTLFGMAGVCFSRRLKRHVRLSVQTVAQTKGNAVVSATTIGEVLLSISVLSYCLQCFHIVGWASGKSSLSRNIFFWKFTCVHLVVLAWMPIPSVRHSLRKMQQWTPNTDHIQRVDPENMHSYQNLRKRLFKHARTCTLYLRESLMGKQTVKSLTVALLKRFEKLITFAAA